MRLTRNQLYSFRVPRVQIPISPPITKDAPCGRFFVIDEACRNLKPRYLGTLGRRDKKQSGGLFFARGRQIC